MCSGSNCIDTVEYETGAMLASRPWSVKLSHLRDEVVVIEWC
jgi:hypothetical protein